MFIKTFCITCIVISIISGTVQANKSDSVADSLKTVGAKSGGVNSGKKKIPNWVERPVSKNITKSPNSNLPSIINGSAGSRSFFGNRSLNFNENPEKPGFPIGWSTNSDFSILKSNADSSFYIELEASKKITHIARVFDFSEKQPLSINMQYSLSSKAQLQIMILNKNNAKTAKSISSYLESGINKEISIPLDLSIDAARFLVVIEKQPEGYLKLNRISFLKGGIENVK
jgi:hypothetical protein